MSKQDPRIFRSSDQLSSWTEKLAAAIPYPAMQFDTRGINTIGSNRVRDKSRLYYNLLPHGYLSLDVYAVDLSNVSGCVVFIVEPSMYDYPKVIVPSRDDFSPVIDAFLEVAANLPDGCRLAEDGEAVPKSKGGLETLRLIELGRIIFEARTGNPFPKGLARTQ